MTFTDLGLDAPLVSRLSSLGLTQPTPIQTKAIPHALAGRDVLGIAQTGTGKTAAFGLPLVTALGADSTRPAARSARGLVLAPTRGRLIDLMDRRAVDLGQTRFLVLDEADQMLDIGFVHALRRIAPRLRQERQTMMFSATMPKQMAELSREYLTDPVRVEVSPPGQAADKVAQSVHFVPKEGKQALLVDLLDGHRDELALVFARTKHGAERLMKQLDRAGFAAASIHGNKSQGQRDRALASFRSGAVRVLVATDVAARGIDIPDVRHVYNYDLPNVPENYVHRIGRTARAGQEGRAVAFCAEDEMSDLRGIEKVLGSRVEIAGGRPWQDAKETAKPKGNGRRRRRSGRRTPQRAA
jgi:ATP-dependent RNA helicase RhlE